MKGYKVYHNKYHEKKEWELLKEQSYDNGTVSIFRSMTAVRDWVVTKTLPDGDVVVSMFDNDIEAWRNYHSICMASAEQDSEFWFNLTTFEEKVG